MANVRTAGTFDDPRPPVRVSHVMLSSADVQAVNSSHVSDQPV